MKEESGTRMAENVLHADLNLPESTRPRILKVPDVPGKSRCSRTRVPVLLAVLVVIILIMVIPLYLTLTNGATAGSQENSTKLPPSHEGAPGKRCSRTRVAVLVTEIILLLLTVVCQILPGKSCRCSRRLLAVLAAVLVVAVLALTLCWTLLCKSYFPHLFFPHAGCPPKWEKHGRKCYFFSPEKGKDWNVSRDECAALGSELVIIDSTEELNYLLSQSKHNYYLLGLRFSQEEKKWKWPNNVELDPAMFNIIGKYQDYLCTVIGFGEVHAAPCYGTSTTKNMCEKAATVSARLQKES
ncbi:PREDICTED: C-type lectin domain family 2 member D-related protein [Corvus brachyrhynchos]|uniref:C-type lectin domain family 2 member D-related protein n=1 Tax=Corvus brachyrhynchos TaxID=85066 RepID=UPI0008167CD0|nr:PREDICTED: C-type lectin domain family 2 member D-related protein [Corvus brachyrhynchos]